MSEYLINLLNQLIQPINSWSKPVNVFMSELLINLLNQVIQALIY